MTGKGLEMTGKGLEMTEKCWKFEIFVYLCSVLLY